MRAALLVALTCAILTLPIAPPAGAADGFYLARLEAGGRAYDRGDFARAASELRIAAFGLLEEPERLAEALIRLALAHDRADGDAGFRAAFERLLEVEERFSVYAAAPVEHGLRAAFEEAAWRRVPAPELASSPTFAPLVEAREAARVSGLSSKERRAELERAVEGDGADIGSLMGLARLDAEAGRPKRAVERLDRVLALEPGHTEARCLRGGQLIGGSRCSTAIEDLQQCPTAATDPGLAAGLLECLIKTRRPAEASAFLASLPDPLRSDPGVARVADRVERSERKTRPAAGPGSSPVPKADPPPAVESPPAAPEAATPAPSEGPAEAERQSLERARERLREASSSADVEAAFEIAASLADRHAGWADAQLLAGELAYLSSRWAEAASYFRRAGPTPNERPDLLFYMAVALYESGAPAEAAEVLERALPRLERTPYVERYVGLILG